MLRGQYSSPHGRNLSVYGSRRGPTPSKPLYRMRHGIKLFAWYTKVQFCLTISGTRIIQLSHDSKHFYPLYPNFAAEVGIAYTRNSCGPYRSTPSDHYSPWLLSTQFKRRAMFAYYDSLCKHSLSSIVRVAPPTRCCRHLNADTSTRVGDLEKGQYNLSIASTLSSMTHSHCTVHLFRSIKEECEALKAAIIRRVVKSDFQYSRTIYTTRFLSSDS